tara:strand:+ start:412 stop:567 length:156 start_codon:yes stop_codon:yes gene_type:complete
MIFSFVSKKTYQFNLSKIDMPLSAAILIQIDSKRKRQAQDVAPRNPITFFY